ncbi:MAG: bifunctional hydroxymethylpyrimidine kinase/phosphomethylpyrimidine kinase, partial [Gemmatimonadaceae bacterium]|nr:bifunctional hydroxymethylpyrimidine kinase/phosphomethylpyrimidine kinase [Acetobacteraceae bacterium]
MTGRVLIVAGSDSGGGAGIQADTKAVMALGAYAATAITALTAQNTCGVHGVFPVPPAFVQQQMTVVLDDIGADAIKTGMLGTAEMVSAVAATLRQHAPGLPVVVDPVMVAKGGARLLDSAAVDAMRGELLPIATLLTPNIPEAEALTGQAIPDHGAALRATEALLRMGVAAVLLKGGHLDGEIVQDILATAAGVVVVATPRIDTRHTHGTGCTLASAIAAGLAQGMTLESAVRRA